MKKVVIATLFAISSYLPAAVVPGSLSARARVTNPVDDRVLVTLAGNTHRATRDLTNDRGAVAANFSMPHMLLQLKRSPEQETALQKAMEAMNKPGSPTYHSWLSEQEFDEQYGVNHDDLVRVTSWLAGHGFTVGGITPDGMVVDFSGTAAMVREAFHTDIHRLELRNGEKHVANMSDPQIPASLASVVVGPTSLSDFKPRPTHTKRSKVVATEAQKTASRLGMSADYTAPEGDSTAYLFTPGDAQTIYNTTPLLAAGHTGKGQTIGLIEDETAYDPSGTGTSADWTTFMNTFDLAKYGGKQTTSFPAGPIFCGQPGDYSDGTDIEVALDIEYASAMAPGANVVVEACQDGYSTFGGLIAVENLVSAEKIAAPVLSISYGFCEVGNGAANNAAYSYAYQHGAARGVSIFVSSGDDGARSCDDGNDVSYFGTGTSGFATTPYNVAVGGTDFSDTYSHTRSTYWNSFNASDFSSAKSYIPEIPWNDTCASELISGYLGYPSTYGANGFCESALAATFTPSGSLEFIDVVAASGGPSSCYSGTPDDSGIANGTCKGQPKPSWQRVFGNPNDSVRDIPDVSLFASNGIWGHYIVLCASNPAEGQDGTQPCTGTPDTWVGEGGTSASAPMMAGIQTLINDYTKEVAGNPNYLYYSLANTEYGSTGSAACNSSAGTNGTSGCIFHDITLGDINTPCTYYPNATVSFNCFGIMNDTNINAPSGFPIGVGSLSATSYQKTYGTNVGWDFATGIGSVNAWNLAQGFAKAYGAASPFKATVGLTESVSSYVYSHGPTSITLTATVTGTGTYPTGTVTFAIGGTVLSTVTLEPTAGCSTGGSCTEVATYAASTASLGVGAYTVTATYNANNENYGTSNNQVTLRVVKAGTVANTTALTVSPSTFAAGSSNVVLATKVSSASGTPSGTVTFTISGVSQGVCTLNGSSACSITIYPTRLLAGTHPVIAVYSGSPTYASSTSAATNLVITPAATTTVASGSSSVVTGGMVTLVATVKRPAGYNGIPTGKVQFTSAGLLLSSQGAVTLDPTGKAVYEQELTGVIAGTYQVIAKYSGDSTDSESTSQVLTVVVTRAETEVTLKASANPVAEGTSTLITATVSHACCSTITPTGTVTFLLGAKTLGAVSLGSGSAALSVSTTGLAPGKYSVVVNYSGDATNQPSTRTLSLTVAAPAAS